MTGDIKSNDYSNIFILLISLTIILLFPILFILLYLLVLLIAILLGLNQAVEFLSSHFILSMIMFMLAAFFIMIKFNVKPFKVRGFKIIPLYPFVLSLISYYIIYKYVDLTCLYTEFSMILKKVLQNYLGFLTGLSPYVEKLTAYMNIFEMDSVLSTFGVIIKILQDKALGLDYSYLLDFKDIFLSLIITILAILYLVQYLYRKGPTAFNFANPENQHFALIFTLQMIFNTLIAILLIYYLTFKWRPIELLLVILFVICNRYLTKYLVITIYKIHDYNFLKKLQMNFSEGTKNVVNQTNNTYLIAGAETGIFILELTPQYRKLSSIPIISYAATIANYVGKAMIFSAIIVPIIGIILKFNLLSILYFELGLIVWISYFSIIQYIPRKMTNIELVSGELIEDIFIIEDLSQDYLITINYDNHQERIMKSAIVRIADNNAPLGKDFDKIYN